MSSSTQALVCLLGALLVAALIAAAGRPALTDAGERAGGRLPTGMRVDPNTADAATLQLLPGIGPGIAEHVIEAREGGLVFEKVEDLEAVRFIGPSVVERVRPWVEFGRVEPGLAGEPER